MYKNDLIKTQDNITFKIHTTRYTKQNKLDFPKNCIGVNIRSINISIQPFLNV